MAYSAIAVEGGLLPPDLLERIAEGDAEGLRPVDFDLDKGIRLTDEFQSAFSDVGSLWRGFDVRLRSSKDSRTTLTREFWMKPALERLGYGTLTYQQASLFAGGESFDISHRAGEDELAPPVHIVSLDQPLGTRGERSRRSPHATVQEYLNRSDALWGLVTNGERIRLLRDSSRISHPTYAEFDLRPMIEGNLYSEFTILYRILHRTRLPRDHANPHECLLENWYQRGVDEGNRVRDHLRDGVEAALKVLGTGFLAHPASEALRKTLTDGTLTEAAFYRQLLRLVYRLLFLFTIEERRLVLPYTTEHRERQTIYANYYSVNRLRDRCERPFADDQYADLWPGLCRTFTLFRDDDAARSLGLAALNGELFGPDGCKDLEAAQCMNKALLLGMYHLSTFRDGKVSRRVNYAALDVEELGSVYESLLDYRPHLTHDPWQFDLAAGSERKKTGSYYTPPELVHELIEHALVPVMTERVNAAKTADEKVKALLAMRVCDPASGSGHFLLAAARRMARELARIRTGEAEPSPEEFRHAERDVIRHCIYAVDKNPLAVDLCKVALWLESHDTGKPLSFLDHHIRCGDSLIGVFDLEAMERGIPDDAFTPKPGDDKKLAGAIKKRNNQELRQDALFGSQLTFLTSPEEVQAYFTRMDGPDDTVDDVYAKEQVFHRHMRSGTAWKRRLAADLSTGAFYWPLKDGTAEPPTNATWRRLTNDPHLTEYISSEGAAYRGTPAYQTARRARAISRQNNFFHWPLEFPEVFDGRESGFDVVLGNPPFKGGLKISEQFGDSFRHYLSFRFAPAGGTTDLCAYFFRRAYELLHLGGRLGMVATNSIGQGDTRYGGLGVLVQDGAIITFAQRFVKWPGDANVEVNLVSVGKGINHGTSILDGIEVSFVSSRLDEDPEAEPRKLRQNSGKGFIGSYVRGIGFVVSPDTADILIRQDVRNADCLRPFLNGDDINSDPQHRPSRWVIDFQDWSIARAQSYPALFDIVNRLVKPERDKLRGDSSDYIRLRNFYWQHARFAVALYKSIARLDRVMVRALTSEMHAFAFVPTDYMYSHAVGVFAFDDNYHFSLLQSNLHESWVHRNASTLESRTRYTPTDCFETFPMPQDVPEEAYRLAADAGREYDECRRQIMLARSIGLTKTYNLYHDPYCSDKDICRLRDLHMQIDNTVLGCYGWLNMKLDHHFINNERGQTRFAISSSAHREILRQLVNLNIAIFTREEGG